MNYLPCLVILSHLLPCTRLYEIFGLMVVLHFIGAEVVVEAVSVFSPPHTRTLRRLIWLACISDGQSERAVGEDQTPFREQRWRR